jgi:hypothetical protein
MNGYIPKGYIYLYIMLTCELKNMENVLMMQV